MGLKITPEIMIDRRIVACTADRVDVEPTAIRGLEIQWGRSDYHDSDAEPASARLTMTDVTGTWAERIRTGRAIGLAVDIRWTGVPTTAGGIKLGPVVMFSGRISSATARPMDLKSPTGETRWEIQIVAADRTADGGNAIAPPVEWPAESMLDRAIKIRDLFTAGGADIRDVFFWPGYLDANTWPLDVKGKSALDLLGAFYQSMGNDAWAYDPDANVVRQVIRLSQPMTVHLGSFDDNLGAVYPVPSDIEVDGVTYPGVALGGCDLIGEPVIKADPATAINRLECSWKDYATSHKDTKTVHENVYPGDARRVLAWESWLRNGLAIDPTLANVWQRVTMEGARPRHPEFTTAPTHEFVTERMARWILQTWENTRPAFIAGDLAYQWLMGDSADYPPIVAPIGGTTTYDPDDGWSVDLRVHWINNQTPPAASATWRSLEQTRTALSQPSVPWWWPIAGLPIPKPVEVGERTPERDLTWGAAAAGSGYRFGDSVTWGDMRHVPTSGTQIVDHLE